MSNKEIEIKNQLINIISKKYGVVEENLVSRGIIDSLTAVEFSIELEKEFDLDLRNLKMSDLETITALSEFIFKSKELINT